MWDVIAREIKQMEQANSPNLMLKHLCSAIFSICASFSLSFPGKTKKATTDDFIPSLVLVLLRSSLTRPVAMHKYLLNFANMGEDSGFEA